MSLPRRSLPRVLQLPILAILCLPAASASAAERIQHNGVWLTPQEIAALPAAPAVSVQQSWGIQDTSSYTVGACEATNRDSSQNFTVFNCTKAAPALPGPDSVALGFPVHLPNGALIEAVTMNYFDTHPDSSVATGMFRIDAIGAMDQILVMATPDFTGGDNSITFVPGTPPQVDNDDASYVILVILDSASGTEYEGVYNFTIHYRLQVSPAPGTATFADVPTNHPFFQYVEALVASGITAGCGGGLYCVDAPLTRGQMAVFLSVALGLHFPN